MGNGYGQQVRKVLRENGCTFVRKGRGDHEIWASPLNNVNFTVDQTIKSRHTANEIMKQPALNHRF